MGPDSPGQLYPEEWQRGILLVSDVFYYIKVLSGSVSDVSYYIKVLSGSVSDVFYYIMEQVFETVNTDDQTDFTLQDSDGFQVVARQQRMLNMH